MPRNVQKINLIECTSVLLGLEVSSMQIEKIINAHAEGLLQQWETEGVI